MFACMAEQVQRTNRLGFARQVLTANASLLDAALAAPLSNDNLVPWTVRQPDLGTKRDTADTAIKPFLY